LFGKFEYPEAKLVERSAYLQRWPIKPSDLDRENNGDPNLVEEIEHRPAPVIMKFEDYDRGGDAT